jgi:hypothetical protein
MDEFWGRSYFSGGGSVKRGGLFILSDFADFIWVYEK